MGRTVLSAMLGAIALAVLNFTLLLGSGYLRIAEQHLGSLNHARALGAADVAAHLPPWSSAHLAARGWALAEDHRPAEARAAYASALRWAPADPLLWAEYALVEARLGNFDAPLTLATTQASLLAPQSPAVQNTIADMGLSYWAHGSAQQRSIWLDGMRYELAHARTSFLERVMTRGRGRTFCEGPAQSLDKTAWCESVAPALLGGCFTPGPRGPVPCETP